MKRNQYPKNLKKKLKKRSPYLKKIKEKQPIIHEVGKKQTTTFPSVRNISSRWRIPAFVFVMSLIVIVLILPTLIVIPFIKNEETHTVEETSTNFASEDMDSPFSVSVMRSVSNEVENVPLETYVARVVASEMPAEFEKEALKAQALAARTFIVNRLLHIDDELESDVNDTTQHQVYHNETELREQLGEDYEWKMEKITEAVHETQGEILTYEGTTITPSFFSTSNGFTENSEDYWENELPYLRSVESKWDEESPKFLDQKVFSVEQMKAALQIDLPNTLPIQAEMTRTESGRVDELILAGHTFSGREIREKLELPSSDFSIKQVNDHLVFQTKGYGHGVGMSQYGANGMAKEGENYEDIVRHYYTGIEIGKIDEIAPKLVSNQ